MRVNLSEFAGIQKSWPITYSSSGMWCVCVLCYAVAVLRDNRLTATDVTAQIRASTAPHSAGLIRDSIRMRVPRLSLLKTLGAQVAVAQGVARKPHV